MAKPLYPPRPCPACGKTVRITVSGWYSKHTDGEGNPCHMGHERVSLEELQLPPEAPECQTQTATPTATVENLSDTTTPGSPTTPNSSPKSSETLPDSPTPSPENAPTSSETVTDDASPTGSDVLPGVDEYAASLGAIVEQQKPVYAQPDPAKFPEVQPYSQPGKVSPAVTEAMPMGDMGQQITSMIKEIFRQYVNRTGRSAQKTLGPSQIGTPCDRRLAMHLLEMPPVNPGNDGWAAFVGTCGHTGFEQMMTWADAGQGRFVTELALQLPNKNVPHGTADLLDRVLCMIDDYKFMGTFALDKLKRLGPSETYKVQLQTYGYAASIRGERIEHVALIALPRDKATLDDMYVWTAPYDPEIARNALARVDRIAAEVEAKSQPMHPDGDWSAPQPYEVAQQFPIVDDCKYCDFYQPNAKDLSHGGCNGRQ